jgi:hypothetical protein
MLMKCANIFLFKKISLGNNLFCRFQIILFGLWENLFGC